MNYRDNAEQRARRVVRDVGTDLCEYLNLSQLHPDLLAELYLQVQKELLSGLEQDRATSLALVIYLVIVSQQPSVQTSPDLIPRLERVITRSLSLGGPSSSPTRRVRKEELI